MSNGANMQAVLQPDGVVTNNAPQTAVSAPSLVDQIDAKMKSLSDRMQAVTDAFLNLLSDTRKPTKPPSDPCLPEATIEAIADRLITSKNVIVMVGAGISTAAGIPDFRTPGVGLYDNLKKYNLPTPQSIFKLDYFKSNPEPFFTLAKELYPEKLQPTISHCFLKLLHDKGVLRRVFSQNIDTLELSTGLPEETVMEAHGSFKTGTCLECQEKYDRSWVKKSIFQEGIPHCERYKTNEDGDEVKCDGIVKPDIVFFGEKLPNEYHCKSSVDFPLCDLLIVIGTSLSVAPFNRLAENVQKTCPRLMINRNKVCDNHTEASTTGSPLFYFDMEGNHRDVFCAAQCDDGVQMLASLAGWGSDLEAIVEEYIGEKISCKKYVREEKIVLKEEDKEEERVKDEDKEEEEEDKDEERVKDEDKKEEEEEEDKVSAKTENGNCTDHEILDAIQTEKKTPTKEVKKGQVNASRTIARSSDSRPKPTTTTTTSSRKPSTTATTSSRKSINNNPIQEPVTTSTSGSTTATPSSSSPNPGISGDSSSTTKPSATRPSAKAGSKRSSGAVKKAV